MVSMSNFPSREKPIWTSGRKTAIHIGPAAAPTQRTTRQLYIATILDLHDQFEFATRRLLQLGYISFFLVNHRFQIPKPKSTESANSYKKEGPERGLRHINSDKPVRCVMYWTREVRGCPEGIRLIASSARAGEHLMCSPCEQDCPSRQPNAFRAATDQLASNRRYDSAIPPSQPQRTPEPVP